MKDDDIVSYDAAEIAPTVTWGINPGQAIFIDEKVPSPEELPERDRATAEEALAHMHLKAGKPIKGVKVDVAFLGNLYQCAVERSDRGGASSKGRKVKAA